MRTQFLKISYLIFLVIFISLAFMISFLIFLKYKKQYHFFLEALIHQTNEFILLNHLIYPFFYSVRLLSYISYFLLPYIMSKVLNEYFLLLRPTLWNIKPLRTKGWWKSWWKDMFMTRRTLIKRWMGEKILFVSGTTWNFQKRWCIFFQA